MVAVTTDPWIRVIVERIATHFQPERIILFGSRARGDARDDSDYDLLIILPVVQSRFHDAVAIQRVLADLPLSKDVIVASPDGERGRATGINPPSRGRGRRRSVRQARPATTPCDPSGGGPAVHWGGDHHDRPQSPGRG